MKNRSNILNSNSDVIAMRWFFVLVFVLMSCSGVFGQNTNNADLVSTAKEVSVESQESSKLEMVKWFMGSGQSKGVKTQESAKATSKKGMIDAGITPNRILSRTILKKAMTFDQAVA